MVLVTNFDKQGNSFLLWKHLSAVTVYEFVEFYFQGSFLLVWGWFMVIETCKESLLQGFRHMAIEDFDDLLPSTMGF